MTDIKDYGQDPDRLEAQIDVTRNKISEDLRAIGDKLSPENVKHELKEEAKQMVSNAKDNVVNKLRDTKDAAVDTMSATMGDVGEKARRAGDSTLSFARDNAAPLALIGLGLGWLLVSRRRSSEDWRMRQYGAEWGDEYYPEYTDADIEYLDDGTPNRGRVRRGLGRARQRAQSVAANAQHRASELRQQAGEKVQHVREQAGETVQHVREQAGETVQHVREAAQQRWHEGAERARELGRTAQHRVRDASVRGREYAHESPLTVGAIAMATGIGVGLLLPATQKERQVLGPARDRLVDEAKQAAEQIKSTVKDTAREVKNQVSEQSLTH